MIDRYLLLLVPEQEFWNKFWLVRGKMEMEQPEKWHVHVEEYKIHPALINHCVLHSAPSGPDLLFTRKSKVKQWRQTQSSWVVSWNGSIMVRFVSQLSHNKCCSPTPLALRLLRVFAGHSLIWMLCMRHLNVPAARGWTRAPLGLCCRRAGRCLGSPCPAFGQLDMVQEPAGAPLGSGLGLKLYLVTQSHMAKMDCPPPSTKAAKQEKPLALSETRWIS